MASFYFDTSALLKLYIDEEGSSELVDLTADVDAHQLAILDVTFVEARSAIRRRQREHSISGAEADAVLLRLEQDGSSLFPSSNPLPPPSLRKHPASSTPTPCELTTPCNSQGFSSSVPPCRLPSPLSAPTCACAT